MKYRRIDFCLMLLLAFLLAVPASVSTAQANLANQVLRLHVVANSDSKTDQAVKLQVRDAVLAHLAPVLVDAENQQEVRTRVTAELPQLAQVAQATLQEAQVSQSVTVRLQMDDYPTRYYSDAYALPAGQYVGLRVELGAGAGQNWWCVVFPPLCTDAAQAQQTDLHDAYTVRFRIAEMLAEWRN